MIEMIIFAVLTIAFFIGKYLITKPSYIRIMIGVYVTIILISQLYSNLTLLEATCKGNSNFGMAVLVTLVPWVVIFGSIQVMLMVFPSWKRPFSNTFGYGIAKLAGVNSVLFKILKPPIAAGDNKLKKTLHDIYSNPALFINEITPANFDDFVRNSSFMFVPNASRSPAMAQFRNIIRAKELVSEFIWYLLSGLLVTTVSYNAIVNSNCSNSVKEMKKRHDEYEVEVKKKQEEEKSAPPQKVYYIRD